MVRPRSEPADPRSASWLVDPTEETQRAQLVNKYLAAGGQALTLIEGRVLNLLNRSGVFLVGGVLVGTPAYLAMGNLLGVKWASEYRTLDIDIAADYRYPIILPNCPVDVKAALLDSGMGFMEVPALNRKHPSTEYRLRGQKFKIDLLTPLIGKPSDKPIHLTSFNTYATPLRYLDYLLEEIETAVMPVGIGIIVNIPNPVRFALHKIVISQRRDLSKSTKIHKDLTQAESVLQVLFETQPGSVIAAADAATVMRARKPRAMATQQRRRQFYSLRHARRPTQA